jgi:hypothetical protein
VETSWAEWCGAKFCIPHAMVLTLGIVYEFFAVSEKMEGLFILDTLRWSDIHISLPKSWLEMILYFWLHPLAHASTSRCLSRALSSICSVVMSNGRVSTARSALSIGITENRPDGSS